MGFVRLECLRDHRIHMPRKRGSPPGGLASLFLISVVLLLSLAPISGSAQADGDAAVIGTYRLVPSRALGEERRILVHLPRGYEESGRSYPVVYKLHGTPLSLFAPIFASCDLLAESGRIPEVILVGVEQHGHWEVRPREVNGPDLDVRAEEFLEFLTEELVPFVERNYRTKKPRILAGTYDCGLFVVYTLLEARDSFRAYLANAMGGFWLGTETVLGRAATELPQADGPPAFLHVTQWRDAQDGTSEAVDDFLARLEGSSPGGLVRSSEILPHPSHDTWLPYKSIERGLLALFADYKCPESVIEKGLAAVQDHYAAFSERFGATFEVPEMAFMNLADHLSERQEWGAAIEVLERFREEYPRSLDAVFRLARAYRSSGDFDRAAAAYRAALGFENCPPFIPHELNRLEHSAAFAVERAIVETGIEAGIAKYRSLRVENAPGDSFRESEFNEAGYRLLGRDMVAAAIAVFRLNVEQFPESANAYDSLAEAYVASGDTVQAVANYRRSLALDSENANARAMLSKLGSSE
jgi:predicted alpha/beta superfamily hydrolase/tetratricopeptide (TPR) repeat protein